MRITLLGGSTPFALPLFDALAESACSPAVLTLNGRDVAALRLVSSYASRVLTPRGWQVLTQARLDEAVAGADIVVQQIRFGGLQSRAQAEQLANQLGVPADETLGPAGLLMALQAAGKVRQLATVLRNNCPEALIVNLSNPLSVTTSILSSESFRVWGACELPVTTHQAVSNLLGRPPSEVDWAYTGLNHRGFLHDVQHEGNDLLEQLTAVLPDRTLLGVLGSEVAQYSALPLKYFGLFAGHAPHGRGRSAALLAMREEALSELAVPDSRRPACLDARPSPWYSHAVVPILCAVIDRIETHGVVNLLDADDLVREHRVRISNGNCKTLRTTIPPKAVRPWLDRFETHERALLAAVAEPTTASIRAACETDPLLPDDRTDDAVRLFMQSL